MVKAKKKLEEMNADEFMLNGLDSDSENEAENSSESVENSEDEQEEEAEKVVEETTGKKGKSHKDQLERLKEKDPEFYKYLQDHDEQLLDFSASDDEGLSDQSDDENEKDEDDQIEQEGDEQEDMDDVELEEEEEEEGKKVTHEMITKWKSGLEQDKLKTLKTVMSAFHASVLLWHQRKRKKHQQSRCDFPQKKAQYSTVLQHSV